MKKVIFLLITLLIVLGVQVSAETNNGGSTYTVVETKANSDRDVVYHTDWFYLALDGSHKLKFNPNEPGLFVNDKVTFKRVRIIEELQNQSKMSAESAETYFNELLKRDAIVDFSSYIRVYSRSNSKSDLPVTITVKADIHKTPVTKYFGAPSLDELDTHFQQDHLSNFIDEPQQPEVGDTDPLIVDPKIPMPDDPSGGGSDWPNNGLDYAPNDAEHPYVTKSGYGLPLVVDLSMGTYTQPQDTAQIEYTGWKIKSVSDVFAKVKSINSLSSNPEFNILYSPKPNFVLNKSQLELESFIEEKTDQTFKYRFRLKPNPGSIVNARCLYNPPNQADSLENDPYRLQVFAGATIVITQNYKYKSTGSTGSIDTQPLQLENNGSYIYIKIKGSMFDDDQPVITR